MCASFKVCSHKRGLSHKTKKRGCKNYVCSPPLSFERVFHQHNTPIKIELCHRLVCLGLFLWSNNNFTNEMYVCPLWMNITAVVTAEICTNVKKIYSKITYFPKYFFVVPLPLPRSLPITNKKLPVQFFQFFHQSNSF